MAKAQNMFVHLEVSLTLEEDDSKTTDSSCRTAESESESSEINLSNISRISTDTQKFEEEDRQKKKKKKKKNQQEDEISEELRLYLKEEGKHFQLHTQLYKFREHLVQYARFYRRKHPYLLSNKSKYYICTENNGVGCLDLLFGSFCHFMGMQKLKHLPNESGERVFCWLGKRRANEIMPTLRPNHHFVNRLPLNIYLKDKQSLAFALKGNMFQKSLHYPAHKCPHEKGKLISLQILCPHQYELHCFEPCEEPGCYESLCMEASSEGGVVRVHRGRFCPCFPAKYFIPETQVFINSVQQNLFIRETAQSAPESQWIVKPSYLRSGRGIQVLPSVYHLRDFLKIQTSQRFMWGQDYVIQRYIKKPMLTNGGQKFDVRMFLLVIVCKFWRVLGFLHPGYVRKAFNPYRPMERGEKFEPATHMANTRVWMKALANKLVQPMQVQSVPSAGESSSVEQNLEECPKHLKRRQAREVADAERRRKNELAINDEGAAALAALDQLMNSAATSSMFSESSRSLSKDTSTTHTYNTTGESFEPVPLTGFFHNSFASDECEEYNYAVRHGCLKQNDKNLPLITGSNRIPGTPRLGPENTSSKTKVQFLNLPGPAFSSPENPLDQYTSNEEFLVCLRNIVSSICKSMFSQVKRRSNCYQLFSLDICIDEHGKPWLLETNPSIITEDVNWSSSTIRNVVPAVFIESLSLAYECTKKSLNFLALRTPTTHRRKPNDLVFRQNFLWMYSTPNRQCDMFELRNHKYCIDNAFKTQLTSKGIMYQPVDYYPERNRKSTRKSVANQNSASDTGLPTQQRSQYRFPTPISSVPVLEEDISYSTRYQRRQLDTIGRQLRVRRLQHDIRMRTEHNVEIRFKNFHDKQRRLTFEKRLDRVPLD